VELAQPQSTYLQEVGGSIRLRRAHHERAESVRREPVEGWCYCAKWSLEVALGHADNALEQQSDDISQARCYSSN
jgi:hypothetical protein